MDCRNVLGEIFCEYLPAYCAQFAKAFGGKYVRTIKYQILLPAFVARAVICVRFVHEKVVNAEFFKDKHVIFL